MEATEGVGMGLMTQTEIVNALRDILQFLEEEIVLPDVENFNRKTRIIEDIRKRYPRLKRPIIYKGSIGDKNER